MSAQSAPRISEIEYNAKVKENEDLRKRMEDLKQQVRTLKNRCSALEKWKNDHKAKWDAERKIYQMDKKQMYSEMVSLDQVKEFLAEYGGLSRYTIVNDAWHAKHPKAANNILGFRSWEEGKQLMRTQFPDMIQLAPSLSLSRSSKKLQLEIGTTLFERCVAVKLMERLGLAASKCGSIYNSDERTVKGWRSDWQKKWGIDNFKVFQSPPLLGPCAKKSRKVMNAMAAAEMAAQTKNEDSSGDLEPTPTGVQMTQGPYHNSQHPPLENTGQEEFVMDQDARREALERHDEAARASSYMTQETTQQPPVAAAVAAFITNNNNSQSQQGPYETGGYYI